MKERKRCGNGRCPYYEQECCGYANKNLGRATRLKTVCDLYGIPYSKSGTLGLKKLREIGCPIHPKTPQTHGENRRTARYDWETARKMADAGKTDKEIGEAIGCTRGTVSSWRRRHGISAGAPQKRIDEAAAMAAYKRGLNDPQIGRELGIGREAVTRWRRKAGLANNAKPWKM